MDTKLQTCRKIILQQDQDLAIHSCIQKNETQLKVGSEVIWLWVAIIEYEIKNILAISISKERNMFVAEHFLSDIVDKHGKYPVSTDGGTWYPQACHFLKLKHHIHSFVYKYEKSIIEELSIHQR